jgi:hypothetical protein
MARSVCEHALSRVLGYLRLCGVPDTREIRLAALKLVEEVVAEAASPEVDSDVLEQVMLRFRHRFALPATILPPVFPPIERGSIHYDDPR